MVVIINIIIITIVFAALVVIRILIRMQEFLK